MQTYLINLMHSHFEAVTIALAPTAEYVAPNRKHTAPAIKIIAAKLGLKDEQVDIGHGPDYRIYVKLDEQTKGFFAFDPATDNMAPFEVNPEAHAWRLAS